MRRAFRSAPRASSPFARRTASRGWIAKFSISAAGSRSRTRAARWAADDRVVRQPGHRRRADLPRVSLADSGGAKHGTDLEDAPTPDVLAERCGTGEGAEPARRERRQPMSPRASSTSTAAGSVGRLGIVVWRRRCGLAAREPAAQVEELILRHPRALAWADGHLTLRADRIAILVVLLRRDGHRVPGFSAAVAGGRACSRISRERATARMRTTRPRSATARPYVLSSNSAPAGERAGRTGCFS